MATQMVVQVVPQQMVLVPQQMVVVKPPGQVRYPGESSMVGKYGGGTFACFDDIESYVISIFCHPCMNGKADAWGSSISGDGPVGSKMCYHWNSA